MKWMMTPQPHTSAPSRSLGTPSQRTRRGREGRGGREGDEEQRDGKAGGEGEVM